MGNGPGKAKVADVLTLTVEDVNEGLWAELPDPANMSEEDIDQELEYLGVDPTEVALEDKSKCLFLVRNPDFWRTHYNTHPAKSRVSAWMMVHRSYRGYSEKIVKNAEAASSAASDSERKTKLGRVKEALDQYEKKLEGHGGFEDEQLFKFFQECVQTEGDIIATNLEDLNNQHKDTEFATAVRTAIEAAVSGGTAELAALVDAAKKYHEHQLEHMRQEERTLVGPWLGLSEEKYNKYRSYVKFPYSFMY